MKLIPLILIIAGFVFIVSAKNDRDPRNVVFEALGIKMRVKDPAPIGVGQYVGQWVQPSASLTPNDGTKTVSV